MRLHHELLAAPGATPTKVVVFLHGILGSGANLRSHARRFIQSRPEFLAALIDLRAHGQSLGVEPFTPNEVEGRHPGDTVAGAAQDIVETAQTWDLPVAAVVGHSFGGKVALAFATLQPKLQNVMTLDSAPGPRGDARGSEQTVQVLAMLETLQHPWRDRDAFIAEVEHRGLSRALGQWLAMNLEPRPEGFVFRLSLERINALLSDYLAIDLWPVVERAAKEKIEPRMHLVIGAKSHVYSPEDRLRAHAIAAESEDHVTVDLLNTSHWVHVEDPQGLSALLLQRLG